MYLNTDDKHADVEVSDNFRYCTNATASWRGIRGALAKAPDTGLHYFEAVNHLADYGMVGIGDDGASLATTADSGNATSLWNRLRKVRQNGASITADQAAIPVGAVIGVLYDSDASTVEFFVDGVSVASPTSVVADTYFPIAATQLDAAFTFRFSESQMTQKPEAAMAWVTDVLADRLAELGPAAHYKLDDTEGTTATDSSGNDNHGTISGGVTLGADPLAWSDAGSNAATFDGLTGNIDTGMTVSFGAAFAVFMLCDAGSADAGSFGRFWSNEEPVTGDGGAGLYWVDASTLRFRSNQGGGINVDFNAGRDLKARNFSLLLVSDGTDMNLVIDGEIVDTKSAPAYAASTRNLFIADRPASDRPNEIAVDDFAFFDRALTAADAFALAERVVQRTYRDTVLQTKPIGYWPLDDADLGALDISGNEYHLSALSGPTYRAAGIVEGEDYSVELNGADQAFQLDAAPVTSFPHSLAAWVELSPLVSGNNCALWIGESGSVYDMSYIVAKDDGSAFAYPRSSSQTSGAVSFSYGFEYGIPQMIGGQFVSSTERRSVLNGQMGELNTVSVDGTSDYTRIAIGAARDSSPGDYLDGLVAHAALWDYALTPAQWSALHYRGIVEAAVALTLDGAAFAAGVPVERTFRAHLASDGSVIGETTSSSADGSWSMPRESTEAIDVIGLPAEGEDPLVMRVPAIES